ncbi:MAG TPA: hypothetical protein VLM40_15855 [Gemmata sp.]|nr:hypothetical protein [Gemmata sp.]
MTRMSRMMIGTALVVGLAAPACAVEPDNLLPANTDAVAIVNLRQIIDSDIVKKYALGQLKQLLEGQDAKKFLADFGIDPLKDVDRLVVGSIETQYKPGTEPKLLFIVHGKFDTAKLQKAAEDRAKSDGDKFAIVKEGDTTLFRFTPRDGEASVYITVVDSSTVVAATDKAIAADAVKAAKANRPAQLKKDLAALVEKLDDKASLAAATILKGKLDDVKIPAGGGIPLKLDGIQKAIPSIESMALAVRIGSDVNMEVSIGMKDEQAAGDLRTTLNELMKEIKPLVQGLGEFEPRAKPLAGVLDSVKISAKSKDVVLSGKVTGADIGKMVNPKN